MAGASETCVVFLLGYPGVGKRTVGSHLAELLDAVLVDNQLINIPLLTLFKWDGKFLLPREIWDRVGPIRDAVLGTIEDLAPKSNSYVFTNVLKDDEAAVLQNNDIEAVADALFESIVALTSHQSPSKRLRLQIASGFDWERPPLLMGRSLTIYNDGFVSDYALTELVHYPSKGNRLDGPVVPVHEIVRAHSLWDGRRITTIGHQIPGTMQVFEELIADEDLPPDPTRPTGGGIAAYVFQLGSVDFRKGELCYVHCIGPYNRSQPGMGPNAPNDQSLCWVTGLLLAFGLMRNTGGETVNVCTSPPARSGSRPSWKLPSPPASLAKLVRDPLNRASTEFGAFRLTGFGCYLHQAASGQAADSLEFKHAVLSVIATPR